MYHGRALCTEEMRGAKVTTKMTACGGEEGEGKIVSGIGMGLTMIGWVGIIVTFPMIF